MTETKQQQYTVGIKIPNKTYAGKPVNPVHTTLLFAGACDSTRLAKLKSTLDAMAPLLPISIKLGAQAQCKT